MKKLAAFAAALVLTAGAAAADYRVTAGRYVVDDKYDFTIGIEGADNKLTLDRRLFSSVLGAIIGDPVTVTVVELPEEGRMTYGGDSVVVLDSFKLSPFKRLCIAPQANNPASFTFIACDRDGKSTPLCRLTVEPPRSAGAPTAFDLTVETAKGLKAAGRFEGIDPDGDGLVYELRSAPSKGDIACSGAQFIYTPHDGERGADSFTYVARDTDGAYSGECEVSVRINSVADDVLYSDMQDSVNHYAALCLTEAGIMSGTRVAGRDFFNPELPVSRGEYLAMLMQAAGVDDGIPTISATGLPEDDEIPLWMKSYVSTAMAVGIVTGYGGEDGPSFDAVSPITRAQAAVMTAKLMGLESEEQYGDAPVWAGPSMSALTAAGLLGDGPHDAPLSRGEAAGILWGVVRMSQ